MVNDRLLGPVRLGQSAVQVSALGFGGAPLGNLYEPIAEADAQGAVHAAYRSGMRYFDTAPLYGSGMSEHRLGEALRRYPRETLVLSTKVGRLLKPGCATAPTTAAYVRPLPFEAVYDYGYDGTMRSFEDSLQRLGTDRIEILLVHDIDVRTHGVEGQKRRLQEALQGAFKALRRLRDERVVGAVGLGVNEWEVCVDVMQRVPIDCVLLAGRYSLLEQGALDVFLPLCAERGVSVIIGGAFNSGILAVGARPGARYDYAPAPDVVVERVRRIEAVCARHDLALAAAALQFPRGHRAVAAVIVGARTPEEVQQIRAWSAACIPEAFWLELKSRGLLRSDAPLP